MPGHYARIHVVPVDDTWLHSAQETCWCHPVEIAPYIWAHNAQDCREAYERQTMAGVPHKPWLRVAEYVRE